MLSLLVNVIAPPQGPGGEKLHFFGNKEDPNEKFTYDANHTSWGNS